MQASRNCIKMRGKAGAPHRWVMVLYQEMLRTLLPGPRPMQSSKAAWTVQNTVGAVQASWKDSAGGLRTTRPAGTWTKGPRQPGAMPMTASPVVRDSTPVKHGSQLKSVIWAAPTVKGKDARHMMGGTLGQGLKCTEACAMSNMWSAS